MKKVWKWVIGIMLVLVVLAALVGVGFMMRSHVLADRGVALDSREIYERGPGMMFNDGFGSRMRGHSMMGFGMMPFGGFLGGLFSLGFLALAVLGVVWLVNRLHTPKPVANVPVENVPATIPAVVMNACKKCGQPVQADWKVCPHCGKKV